MVAMRPLKLVVTLVVAVVAVVLLIEAPREVSGLNNGLALTPPMGWLSWERFRCNVDCDSYPDSCISEQLYMDMADELVEGGYADLGYVFVNVDDCWAEKERDNVTNQMVADRQRFPSGIDGLAAYVSCSSFYQPQKPQQHQLNITVNVSTL